MVFMFRKNDYKQINFDDSVLNMPKYLQNILKNSWDHNFQKYIFPEINEQKFEVLYSDQSSRPNSSINVINRCISVKRNI